MTIETLYTDFVLPLMGEDSSSYEIYSGKVIAVLNTVANECLEIDNALKLKKKLEITEKLPVFTTMNDELPFENEILINVLTFGIGARFFIDENNPGKVNFLDSLYEKNLKKYTTATYEIQNQTQNENETENEYCCEDGSCFIHY